MTAYVFPGQGAQYPGMGKKLCEQSKTVAMRFEEASDILGYDLRQTCLESSKEKMADTRVTQPSVFTVSVAFYEYYKDRLPVPHFMAGHSLGEFSALVCSGALGFGDAVAIIRTRAKLMAEAVDEGEGFD